MKDRLSRLPIAHRLLLSSLAFGVPIAALVAIGFLAVQQRLDTARREKLGVSLAQPLCELSGHAARHGRLASRAAAGEAVGGEAREQAARAVDAAFEALRAPGARAAAGRLGLAPEGRPDPLEELLAAWRRVPSAGSADARSVERAHRMVLDGTAALLLRTLTESRLAFDPALDSHFLAEAAFRALPAASARIAAMLAGPSPSAGERAALAFQADELGRAELPRLAEALAAALHDDAGPRRSSGSDPTGLPALRDRFDASARELLSAARRAAAEASEAGSVDPSADAALTSAFDLRRGVAAELDRRLDARVTRYERERLAVLLLALLAVAISARHVGYIVFGISRPLASVADAAHLVAAGDVAGARERASRVPAGDGPSRNEISRLGGAVREMADGLSSLLLEVQAAGGHVKETSARIAATARELEATSSEQAASANEVSATSREIHRRAEGFAATIGEVGKVVREASDLAGDGRRGLDRMESSMDQLTAATASVSERLAAISGKAEGIGAIVTTIGRVAEQTNLLSFNAAIEAEKAGEAGKGFVVVAREIRRLADRTAAAAVEIGEVVESMRSVVSSGVMEMDRFVDQVRREGEEVRRIGGQLGTVIEQVEALTPRFAEVLAAAEAQAGSAREIREAVSQLSAAAGQTRDTLEEWSRVAQGLDGAARSLAAQVERFRLAGDGAATKADGG